MVLLLGDLHLMQLKKFGGQFYRNNRLVQVCQLRCSGVIEFHQNAQWEMVELDSGLNVRDNRFVRTQQDVDNGAVCSICDVKVSLCYFW